MRVHFYQGEMGSGKSALLMDLASDLPQDQLLVVKPDQDVRQIHVRSRKYQQDLHAVQISEVLDHPQLLDHMKFLLMDEVHLSDMHDLLHLFQLCKKLLLQELHLFGLLYDFRHELFQSSSIAYLLADQVHHLESNCQLCDQPAHVSARVIPHDKDELLVLRDGNQMKPGAQYVRLCKKHYKNASLIQMQDLLLPPML